MRENGLTSGTQRAGARFYLDRLEWPDALLFLYLLCISRQYTWWLPGGEVLAWIVASLSAATGCVFFIKTKEEPRVATPLAFWFVVALPLAFVYALRAAIPDLSFDVLNYRLLVGERALHGFVYLPGDFFPMSAPYNPTPDMITALARHALGYRLGTIINLCALLWTARVVDRLLRVQFSNPWTRGAIVLLIVLPEHLLFEINNYMIDLLPLPLLLEAVRLSLPRTTIARPTIHLARIALLLGLSVTLKLASIVLVLPIVFLCAKQFLTAKATTRKDCPRAILVSLGAFFLPLLPFAIYLLIQTRSPLFPVLNGIFKSPFWPASSGWDPRWGPKGVLETFLWPLRLLAVPERLSELSVYSGRLTLGFIAELVALVFFWRSRQLRVLALLLLSSTWLWCASTGYIRYALHAEVLAGIVVAILARLLMQRAGFFARTCAVLIGLALAGQTALAGYYISNQEWSQRPTFFRDPRVWKEEASFVLRDRELRAFLSKHERHQFRDVQLWVESSMKTCSLEMLLRARVPIIGIRGGEYFVTRESKARFVKALDAAAGLRMFTLCFSDDLEPTLQRLRSRGFQVLEQRPILLPFYSPTYRMSLILLEISGVEEVSRAVRAEIANQP